MVIIEVNNSFSKLKGLTVETHRLLKEVLSYELDPSAVYFSGGWSKKKSLLDKSGNFPTGLLSKVEHSLKANKVPYTRVAISKEPDAPKQLFSLSLGAMTPHPPQLAAADMAAVYKRGTVSMVTGYGKSITMALLIERLQVRTLVIVPNLNLKEQLKVTFKQYFGSLKNITIENIDSSALLTATDYDALIIDEVHHAAAKTYHKFNKSSWNNIYYRFGFTATPFRNNDDEQLLLQSIAGDVLFEVDYKTAVRDKAVVPIEAYYYDLPKIVTDAYTWGEVYKELVVNNDYRNQIIAGLLQVLRAQDKSSLCLIKEIAHGDLLSEISETPFTNGENGETKEYIRQFNSGGLKSLIGTTGVVGEGVDTKPAEYVIIAGAGKAKSAFMQQVGRGLRNYPGKETCKIILFRDGSHKFLLKHFNAQKKILLDEYGVTIVKLELP